MILAAEYFSPSSRILLSTDETEPKREQAMAQASLQHRYSVQDIAAHVGARLSSGKERSQKARPDLRTLGPTDGVDNL